MELVLLRHAQPAWALDDAAQIDPGLTDLGERQAELAADRLADERFDTILVSTAERAQRTADPVLGHHPSVRVEHRAWLHEIRAPETWQGTPQQEVDRAFREARSRPRDAWWDGIPGGETFRDFHARVTLGLVEELAALGVSRDEERLWEVPDRSVRLLLVAHAGTNSLILGHLLGLDPEPWEWERFAMDHASLTLLRAVPIAGRHIFSLQGFSDHAHLPAELRTA
jgi:broad specificity phosphatase PhoE